MKSILIIDTPTTCAGCPCYDYIHGVCAITYKDCELRKQAKPTWCPLKELPSNKEIKGDWENVVDVWIDGANYGYNKCLNDISGEKE